MKEYTDSELARIASARSHREAYPEQYTHPLVGKRVEVRNNPLRPDVVSVRGVVQRVVSSRFGQLANLDGEKDTFYLVDHCHPTEE